MFVPLMYLLYEYENICLTLSTFLDIETNKQYVISRLKTKNVVNTKI